MTSEIVYIGALKTECTHLESCTVIQTSAPKDNNGDGASFSPTDLVATALGACMVSIMGIVARNHDWDISGSKVEVQKVMASDPRRIAEVKVFLHMAHPKLGEKDRQLLENAARTCPVAKSLHPDLTQAVEFHW